MDIVFEAYPVNDGMVSAYLQEQVLFSDATDFVRAKLEIVGSWQGAATGNGSFSSELTSLVSEFFDEDDGLFRASLPLEANWSSNDLAPSIAVFLSSLPQLTTTFSGAQINLGQVIGSLQLQTLLSSEPNYFYTKLPIQTFFSDGSVRMDRLAVLLQQPQLYSDMIQGFTIFISEFMVMGGTGNLQQVMARQDALSMHSADASMMEMLESIGELISFGELAFAVWNILHAESMNLSGDDAAISSMVIQVAETLALLGGPDSLIIGISVVLEALAIGALRGYVWPVAILEQLGAVSVAAWSLLAMPQQTEQLALSGAENGYVTITAIVDEGLLLDDTISTTAMLLNLIDEGIEFLMRVVLPDGEYIAWVCNTESKAFTSYRNFPFNSFAEIGGHYYGCTDTGVYLLEGDDDAGTPISARLRTGLMDMGTGLFKRMDTMYLGYSAAGDLVLKVVVLSPEGQKQEKWYSLQPRPSLDLVASRAKIGKGLKSTYWAFEIANVDGADFQIDTMSFLPLVLERRI
jgi:hypothetical protein